MTKSLLRGGCNAMPLRFVIMLFVNAGLLASTSAYSHDWYPHDCCHDKDCSPVDSVTWFVPPGGGKPLMIVASKHGVGVVLDNVSLRESKDSRMHVCLQKPSSDPFDDSSIICLFIPPLS
jgi:hypothetical protein